MLKDTEGGRIYEIFPVLAVARFFVKMEQRSSFMSTQLFCTAVGVLS